MLLEAMPSTGNSLYDKNVYLVAELLERIISHH